MKRLLFSLVLLFSFSSPAFAEEEVGGWAVVNPETNQVHGVVVCTESVCGSNGSWGGVLPGEYMGCTNCNLVLQTNKTADGNVAGYHGPNVTYNPDSQDFNIRSEYETEEGTVERVDTLTPSETAKDGVNLSTGITKSEVKLKSKTVNEQTASVTVVENNTPNQAPTESVEVKYDQWNGGTFFFYGSKIEALESIDADIESVFTPCNTCNADPVQVEEYRNTFYDTVTSLTTTVKNFISQLFGGRSLE